MRTVHKYQFSVATSYIEMPRHAEILLVALQGSTPTMWAAVNTAEQTVTRKFVVTGTGQPVKDGLRHVASFQDPPFVWHLWEDELYEEQR